MTPRTRTTTLLASARASTRLKTALAALLGLHVAGCPRDEATTGGVPQPETPVTTVSVPEEQPLPAPTSQPVAQPDPTVSGAGGGAGEDADAGVASTSGPGWVSGGAYCVHQADTRPSGNTCGHDSSKLREIVPAPGGMHGFSFNDEETRRERAKVPDACCFRVIRPARGRPLRSVEHTELTAPVISSREWALPCDADFAEVPTEVRERAASRWAEDAALEHASVAEFSRLALSLLAHAAPPALVAGAQRAALDEVEHAQIAYGIAGALAGEPLGPGAIDVARAAGVPSLLELVRECVRDGCIGECIAALELAVASETTTVPELAAPLAHMAEDEARHGELAYAIVAWAIESADAEHRPAIAAILAEATLALESSVAGPVSTPASDEAPVGQLAAVDFEIVRRDGVREVVLPALRMLAERSRAA